MRVRTQYLLVLTLALLAITATGCDSDGEEAPEDLPLEFSEDVRGIWQSAEAEDSDHFYVVERARVQGVFERPDPSRGASRDSCHIEIAAVLSARPDSDEYILLNGTRRDTLRLAGEELVLNSYQGTRLRFARRQQPIPELCYCDRPYCPSPQ